METRPTDYQQVTNASEKEKLLVNFLYKMKPE